MPNCATGMRTTPWKRKHTPSPLWDELIVISILQLAMIEDVEHALPTRREIQWSNAKLASATERNLLKK